jgi:hypothetical protein
MIRFSLVCSNEHEFEGWFQSGAAFENQVDDGHLACPVCDGTQVRKAPMAPSISPKGNNRPNLPKAIDPANAGTMRKALKELREVVETNCENVGDRFADEARKIHYGETEARGIYGETSKDEAVELQDEGVPFARIPWVKPDDA